MRFATFVEYLDNKCPLTNNPNRTTDADLIAGYRNSHENRYVGELFQRYMHQVYLVCYRFYKNDADSKDAVMEIFEKIMTDLKRHNVENFPAWLHVVAQNHCRMKLRKGKVIEEKLEEYKITLDPIMEFSTNSHHNDEDKKEAWLNKLQEGIVNLRSEQRKCVELFYMKEMSYQEVAKVTGYTLKQVKSHLQNGKSNLKIFLSETNE